MWAICWTGLVTTTLTGCCPPMALAETDVIVWAICPSTGVIVCTILAGVTTVAAVGRIGVLGADGVGVVGVVGSVVVGRTVGAAVEIGGSRMVVVCGVPGVYAVVVESPAA